MSAKPESVWDYPRPPRLEASTHRVRVIHAGIVLADSAHALRILETSHPPVYYIPPVDIFLEHLSRSARAESFCEYKGNATYWNIAPTGPHLVVRDAAWSYENPSPNYASLRGHLAFYANRVDECYLDNERVQPQPGDFYGGWITSQVTGPFKGAPGTMGW